MHHAHVDDPGSRDGNDGASSLCSFAFEVPRLSLAFHIRISPLFSWVTAFFRIRVSC